MNKSLKLATLSGVALVAVAGIAHFGWQYYTVGRFEESTDDAYLKADITAISPKITGYVTEVLVQDNQRVKRGQVLVKIDDRDYKAHVHAAEADLAGAKAALVNLDARIQLQHSAIDMAGTDIGATAAEQHFDQEEMTRYAGLAKSGAGTEQRVQQADAALKKSTAAVDRAQAALESAKRQLAVLESQRAGEEADVEGKAAALDLAKIDLADTEIVAPEDGVTGQRAVRVGQLVKPGTQILAVVPIQAIYAVANFKETQLTHMHGGEKVAIEIDSFPGVTLEGHIDSLAPASGAEFSLLPPDNATGNFTKIVQRIPVKILLPADNPLAGRLRPGMSVVSTVDTRDRPALADADDGTVQQAQR
jgi:membrane fusion protein, multidrug efflux system